ncbi:MAG: hypothetical protein LBT56_02070 [Prevotellaceae bacterium]|jgi:hypothetical protein|nr:hypothetical protein [Prevotellaceae bacterium]
MITKMFVLLVLFFHLVSCTNPKKSNFAEKETVTNYDNEQRIDRYPYLNEIILLTNKSFLFYKHISADSFMVIWGNGDAVHIDTLHIFPNYLPLFEWYNKEAICLAQGCGTDCYFAYILLFKTGEVKEYMYPLAYDTVNNLVACAGSYELKELVIVENFSTGEKREIIEDYLPCSYSGHAIESITFSQSGLFVKWQDNKGKTREKVFK